MPATTLITANNPGGLTAGTFTGSIAPISTIVNPISGLTFDEFSSPQQGAQALVNYIGHYAGETVGDLLGRAFPGDQSSVEAQGVSLDDTIGSNNQMQIAAGIIGNEGTASAFGGISNLLNGISSAFNLGQNIGTTGANGVASIGGLIASIENFFSINTAQRATAVVVGVILALIAVAVLIMENKAVQETVRRAGNVATTVAAVAAG